MALVEAKNRVEQIRTTGSLSLEVQQAIQDSIQAKWDFAAGLIMCGLSRTEVSQRMRDDPHFNGHGLAFATLDHIKQVLRHKGLMSWQRKTKKG